MARIVTGLLVVAIALASRPAAAAVSLDLNGLKLRGDVLHAPRDDGQLLPLALDPALQERVEKLLEDSRAPQGAIVAADAKTGRILAWASRGSSRDLVLTPAYPPASLTKVVTAAALLEGEHVFRPTPQCYGGGLRGLSWDDVRQSCRPGESKMPFGEALGYSINVIFGRLAVAHLTGDGLGEMADALGFGSRAAIDVAVPESDFDWPDDGLELARAAAGFSREAKVSPLSVLAMMHVVANGGTRVKLQLVGQAPRREEKGTVLGSATSNALVRMLEVTTRRGTSRKAFRSRSGRPSYRAAGKTGTLVVTGPSRMLSWFAGFAPSRDPEIVLAVMLANDLSWWRKGNQVARDVFDAYFASR